MLTLKGNTAVYKLKICGSALLVALQAIGFRCFPVLGYVILFMDIRQGAVGAGSALRKATTCIM